MSTDKKDLTTLPSVIHAKLGEIMNVDHSVIKEYAKLYARLQRHADINIVKPKRERVSPEHKKEVKKKYYEKVKEKIQAEKQAEKERLKALGVPVRPRGRHKKNPIPENEEFKK
jgi:hypothetical protein